MSKSVSSDIGGQHDGFASATLPVCLNLVINLIKYRLLTYQSGQVSLNHPCAS